MWCVVVSFNVSLVQCNSARSMLARPMHTALERAKAARHNSKSPPPTSSHHAIKMTRPCTHLDVPAVYASTVIMPREPSKHSVSPRRLLVLNYLKSVREWRQCPQDNDYSLPTLSSTWCEIVIQRCLIIVLLVSNRVILLLLFCPCPLAAANCATNNANCHGPWSRLN